MDRGRWFATRDIGALQEDVTVRPMNGVRK
jgi:hypothetical protein